MSRRSVPVLTASIALAVGLTTTLAACSGGDAGPSASPTSSRSASASAPAPTSTSSGGSSAGGSSTSAPGDDQTGPADDGTATGTGNGSGVDQPASVDFGKIAAQGTAAAGGGTVVSITGSGDSWTVVVAGPDGSQTQSVVSATLDRVTSGPFPKQVDAATQASTTARAAALKTSAADAATAATKAVGGGTLASIVLGGSGTAPTWTATVTTAGGARTVSVDGITGAATAS